MTGPALHSGAAVPAQVTRSSELPSLWFIASLLLRNRYLVLAMSLLSGAAAGAKTLLSPREYTASASFVPQQPSAAEAGLGQLASQFGLAPSRSTTTSPQFYADLLTSREILGAAVTASYRLPDSPDVAVDLVRHFRIAASTRQDAVRFAIGRLQRKLDVRTDRSTGVVRFEVRTSDAALSEQVASHILRQVNEFNLRQRHSQAQAERQFVETRMVQAQESLTVAEEALTAFYARNRRFQDSPQLVAEEARLQRSIALRQQLYVTLAQSRENARIQEVRDTPVITVIEHPENFVEARPRHLLGITLLAFLLGGLAAVGLAVARELLANTRGSSSQDYRAFVTLRDETITSLRRLLGKPLG